MAVNPAEADVRIFHPRWPELDRIDPERVRLGYWREVDTLDLDFFGPDQPAVVVPLDLPDPADEVALLVHAETEAVVGVQIEAFLRRAVRRHPHLLDLLDLAELHGITPTEIAELRRTVAPAQRRRAAVAAFFDELAPVSALDNGTDG